MKALVRQDGFTLTEVLVTVAIFSMVVLTLTSALTQGYRGMGAAGRRSVNLHKAQEEMDATIVGDFTVSGDDADDVVVSEEPCTVEVFGHVIQGTFITLKRVYSGQASGEVIYSYFAPGGGD